MLKIYLDSTWRICAIRSTDRTDLMEIEVERERFWNLCDAAILCYCYEIGYQKNESGEFVLDKNGDKIVIYTTTYPAVDYNLIQAIQYQNEENEKTTTTMQLALVEQYEANAALEAELTSTQLALTEIYEGLGVM